jgi:hypothetical protein
VVLFSFVDKNIGTVYKKFPLFFFFFLSVYLDFQSCSTGSSKVRQCDISNVGYRDWLGGSVHVPGTDADLYGSNTKKSRRKYIHSGK